MREVQVRFKLSQQDFVDSVDFGIRRMRNAMLFVLCLYLIATAAGLHFAPGAMQHWKVGVVIVFSCVVGVWLLVRWSLRRQFSRRPDRGCAISYRFSSDGIRSEIEGLARAERAWALVDRIVETPRGFLLFQNAQVYEWLPLHGFDGPDEIETFRQLLTDLGVETS